MVGMRMIEIWRLKPVPRKVAAVGEELFEEYLRKKRELLKNDLGTDWFGRMMAAIFKNDGAGTSPTFTVVDVTNTSHSVLAKSNPAALFFNTTYGYDCGAYIGVGTGTAAPTKTDIKLASEVARNPASATYTDGGDSFVVSATFSLTSDTDIWEIGLYWKMGYTGYIWLLDRTVLSSPVRFPANTPMTVAYKFAIS
jgi:hypothetical protein